MTTHEDPHETSEPSEISETVQLLRRNHPETVTILADVLLQAMDDESREDLRDKARHYAGTYDRGVVRRFMEDLVLSPMLNDNGVTEAQHLKGVQGRRDPNTFDPSAFGGGVSDPPENH